LPDMIGPKPPLNPHSECCGAARHCGLSPQPRNQEIGEFTVCGQSELSLHARQRQL
jgi:hypothetical protein